MKRVSEARAGNLLLYENNNNNNKCNFQKYTRYVLLYINGRNIVKSCVVNKECKNILTQAVYSHDMQLQYKYV